MRYADYPQAEGRPEVFCPDDPGGPCREKNIHSGTKNRLTFIPPCDIFKVTRLEKPEGKGATTMNAMTLENSLENLKKGKKIRRSTWTPGVYFIMDRLTHRIYYHYFNDRKFIGLSIEDFKADNWEATD
jgi:hypothetical protein